MQMNYILPITDDQPGKIPDKDKLQMLVAQCSELAKSFPDMQFKFSAALAIVLGWILTSQETKAFILSHTLVSRTGATLACGVLLISQGVWVFKHYNRSTRVHAELSEFARRVLPEGKSFVESLRIDPFLPWSYLIVNFFMCGAIVVAVWLASLAGQTTNWYASGGVGL
jgi:hypothetical protein